MTHARALARLLGGTAALQVGLVAAGERPATRLAMSRADALDIVRLIEAHDIHAIVGHDVVTGHRIEVRGNYSEWCSRRPLRAADRAARSFVYVARTSKDAERLRACDERNADKEVGSLLGYPACCIEWFCERSSPPTLDPVLASYGAVTEPIPWPMNVSFLHRDCTLLSHIPCAAHCSESLAQARQFFTFLARTDGTAAEQLRVRLTGWVLHTNTLGIAKVFGHLHSTVITIEAADELEPDAPVAGFLQKGTRVEADTSGVHIGSILIETPWAALYDFANV